MRDTILKQVRGHTNCADYIFDRMVEYQRPRLGMDVWIELKQDVEYLIEDSFFRHSYIRTFRKYKFNK